jgi:CheY-like chemotaxis protein
VKRILIIDDDDDARSAMRAALEGHYDIVEAPNGADGISQFDAQDPDLIICDIIMPDVDGLEAIQHFRRHSPQVPVVLVSGGGRIAAADYLRIGAAFGAQKCLAKPLRVRELQEVVSVLLGGPTG